MRDSITREKIFKIKGDDISDGYHSFDELYQHRNLLFINLCLKNPEECVWRPDYDGHFVLYWESPVGQISYHLGNELLPYIEDKIKLSETHEWDRHTSKDVINRLTAHACFL